MTGEFQYQALADSIQKAGFPKAPKERMSLLLEMENWYEFVFDGDDAKAAAIRVGRFVLQAPNGLYAWLIAYRLYKRNRRAFLAFRALVDEEVRTGALRKWEHQQALEVERQRAEAYVEPFIVFSRKEFYELVWSTPARTLSADLGISDVMIGKICKKHNIPKPYLGYWAKYYAGDHPKQRPLPKMKSGAEYEIKIRQDQVASLFLNNK